ncbi:MAG: sulfite exporter TauE/SafE family protein [Candidatus Hydrogenedentes bacterium]|nr:sulfite exporter TauE/SafE family protein [Candidatus Hydrogenedentota bacterium]
MPEIVVFIALLLGGAVHTTAGFGSALIAMPILTLVLHPVVATPLQTLVGLSLSATIFYQYRAHWPWPDAVPLVLFSILGIPLGTLAITTLPESVVLGALGVVLLLYAAFETLSRTGPSTPSTPGLRADPLYIGSSVAGFLSGVLGAAYATNGPPAIIYGSWRRWPRGEFKSVLQSMFVVNGICILLWQGGQGLLTREVGWYALFAAPGLLIGALIGRRIDKRLDSARFQLLITNMLFVLGIALILRAILAR